jgi:hypothetical protein
MKKLIYALLVTAFAMGSAAAQETYESKAVGKNGKPLAGAAKNSFMTKCKREACAPKQGSWIRRQAPQGCGEDELHGKMRERAKLTLLYPGMLPSGGIATPVRS